MASQKVEWKQEARNSITAISFYITEKGYPETSKKFSDRLYEFGESLLVFPEKYPLCRFQKLAKRNMHCAVFHKNYMFIYKQLKNILIIYNVIHCNTIPASHSV